MSNIFYGHRFLLPVYFLLLVTGFAYGQSTQELVNKGIEFHDKGEYEQAIKFYTQALEQDANSSLIHSEMALTYQTLKDYQKAFEHAKRAVELDEKNIAAQLTLGSSLDDLGKPEQAIAVFENYLKKFGGHHLAHYNLALTLSRLAKYEEAEKNLLKALELKPAHPSSHLLLANIQKSKANKTQALLGYYYFLLLEPATERSKEAFASLQELKKANVSVNPSNGKEITITVNKNGGSADLMTALMQAVKSTEEMKELNKNKTEGEIFVDESRLFFEMAGIEKVKKKDRDMWNQQYAPFFSNLAKTDHIQAFCYYISQASSEQAKQWLENNPGKVEQFGEWLKK